MIAWQFESFGIVRAWKREALALYVQAARRYLWTDGDAPGGDPTLSIGEMGDVGSNRRICSAPCTLRYAGSRAP
jgi:hypothetical protein